MLARIQDIKNKFDSWMTKDNKIVAMHISGKSLYLVVANNREIKLLKELPLNQEELTYFVKHNKLTNFPAFIVIDGSQIITRTITIPAIPTGEIRQVLQWELTKDISFPPEKIIYDYEVVERFEGTHGKKLRLIVIAAKLEYIENYCHIVAQTGLKPQIVETEGTILYHLYLQLASKQVGNSECCLFFNDEKGVFTFIKDNRLFYIQNFTLKDDLKRGLAIEYQRVSTYLLQEFNIKNFNNIYLFCPQVYRNCSDVLINDLNTPVIIAQLPSNLFKLPDGVETIDSKFYIPLGILLREVN